MKRLDKIMEKEIIFSEKKKFILGLILGICGVIIWNIYYDSTEKMYTVGIVTGTQTGKSSGTNVNFDYFFNGSKKKGLSAKGYYSAGQGDKFIVAFEKDKATFSKILLYYPIPDTLEIKAPGSGWSKIPDEIIKHRLKRKEDFGLREYFHEDK